MFENVQKLISKILQQKLLSVQNNSCLSSQVIPNIFVNHKVYCMVRKVNHLLLLWTIKFNLPSSHVSSVRYVLITFFHLSLLSECDPI